jgi:hypothetical protein
MHPAQVGIPGGGVVMAVPLQSLVFGQKKVAGSIVGGRADMQVRGAGAGRGDTWGALRPPVRAPRALR